MAAGVQFAQHSGGAPLTFMIKKFVDQPWLIVMIAGANQVLSVLVAPYASWKADRIWTRFGRRKPFMMLGWSLMAVGVAIIPFAANIEVLIMALVLWLVSFDFGYMGVWTPLCFEVVPSQQRGRSQVIRKFIGIPMSMGYNYFLIRQLDNTYDLPVGAWLNLGEFALRFNGYHVIFLSGSLALVAALTMLVFGLKETPPTNPATEKKFTLGTYFLSLFGNHQWRMIYSLIFCIACMTAGLASLGPLLIRDQWHYNMKDLGLMGTIQVALDVAIILPVAALIVDRFNRFKIFQWGLLLSTLHPLAYWLFVKYFVPNHIPSIPWIIGFNMFNAVVDGTAAIALEPLLFDLIPRNMMGTVNSGFLLVRHMLGVMITYGVGFWVTAHGWLYKLPMVAGKEGKLLRGYDYMSGYLYVFALGVAGCIVAWYFGHQLKTGRIIQYGKLEDEGHPVEMKGGRG
jgi:MFS family permease